jgi:hypothetical protein
LCDYNGWKNGFDENTYTAALKYDSGAISTLDHMPSKVAPLCLRCLLPSRINFWSLSEGSFAMMNPDELRQMAAHFRLIALDGDDMHLVAALRQLAEEFDAEATAVVVQQDETIRPPSPLLHGTPCDAVNHS